MAAMASPTSLNISSPRVVPNLNLPAGFRFHPTDEELIVHYLMNQAASIPCPVPIIAEFTVNSDEFARYVRAALGGAVPVDVFHREPEPGVVYANIRASSWQQQGSVDVVLLSLRLPDGVIPVQPRRGAERGVVLAAQLPRGGGGGGGAVYSGDYVTQPRPGAEHGEVIVGLLSDGAGHGEVFVGLLSGGVDTMFDNSDYSSLQPHPGARHGDVLVDLLPNDVGHGEVFVDSSRSLADDLSSVYDNRGMVGEHMRRLFAFVGIATSSVAVNWLAAGPGSPAVAFHLFMMLLGGLFLVILHVLHV